MSEPTMHIGEVAERIGLSLRTIRYYEEVGLIAPSARTQGGFRLYTDADATRLQLVKDMKPLGFSLDEMRDLLGVLDQVDDPRTGASARAQLTDRLAMYRVAADARCDALRGQLRIAESFSGRLRGRFASHQDDAAHPEQGAHPEQAVSPEQVVAPEQVVPPEQAAQTESVGDR